MKFKYRLYSISYLGFFFWLLVMCFAVWMICGVVWCNVLKDKKSFSGVACGCDAKTSTK